MLLHEAIKKARKELGLSQKQLADLAGIQRKQLGTVENGGNITLSTLRKILAQLPNLETFTIDTVTATVRRQVRPEETVKAVESAMSLMMGAVRDLAAALGEGKLPEEDPGIRKAGEALYDGFGLSPEDFDRDVEAILAERAAAQGQDQGPGPGQEPAQEEAQGQETFTAEQAVELLGALVETDARFKEMREEESGKKKDAGN